jgi:hypothetical protein
MVHACLASRSSKLEESRLSRMSHGSRVSRGSHGSRVSRGSHGSFSGHPALQQTSSSDESPRHDPKPQAIPSSKHTRSDKSPLLPKESRPPPVIYDASVGGNWYRSVIVTR